MSPTLTMNVRDLRTALKGLPGDTEVIIETEAVDEDDYPESDRLMSLLGYVTHIAQGIVLSPSKKASTMQSEESDDDDDGEDDNYSFGEEEEEEDDDIDLYSDPN